MNTIALELERLLPGSVAKGANLIFENLVLQRGDVSYNTTTGVISLNKAGRYLINWEVATQGTVGTQSLSFSIVSSTGGVARCDSPIKLGEVVGFTILETTAAATFSLVNQEPVEIYLSPAVKVRARLTVSELLESDAGVPGPPGPPWESAGLQMLGELPTAGNTTTVPSGGFIPFDNKVLEFNNITYADNSIKIGEPGYYLITWEFIAKPQTTGEMVVYLQDTEIAPSVYGKSGSKSQEYTTIVGTALVMVTTATTLDPMVFQLINQSSVTLVLEGAYNAAGNKGFTNTLTVAKIGDVYFS